MYFLTHPLISHACLLNNLFIFSEVDRHREAYEKAIKNMISVCIRVVRLNCIGLPRSGKTLFLLRLMKEIKNYIEALDEGKILPENPSTGAVKCVGNVYIKKSLSHKIGAILSKEWHTLKSLAEEGYMILQLIRSQKSNDSPNDVASSTGKKPTASPEQQTKKKLGPVNLSETEHTTASEEEDVSKKILTLINEGAKNNELLLSLLEDIILIIGTDSGGQAEFLDLHASLVDGPMLNLLFHRLQDDLDENFDTYYTDEHGVSTEKVPSIMTVEEVIFQALSSIACFSNCFNEGKKKKSNDGSEDAKSKSKVMFVGTYRDEVRSDLEFQKKDQNLRDKIKSTQFFNKDIIKYADTKAGK